MVIAFETFGLWGAGIAQSIQRLDYGLDDPGIGGSIPGRGKIFFSSP
jgi:hypothetical protein